MSMHDHVGAMLWRATGSIVGGPGPTVQGVQPAASIGVAHIALLALGAGIIGTGVWLLVRARQTMPGTACDPPLPAIGAVRRSTLYTLAMCVIVTGYHIAAWTVPHVLGLHVPAHRAWMLIVGVALAVAGSVWAERIEKP